MLPADNVGPTRAVRDLFMARHIAAETGSYAAIYCVRTSTVCGHRRCFNLGNFQIECVRHYETTVDEYTGVWVRKRRGRVVGGSGGGRFPGKYVSTYALPAFGINYRYRCLLC